MANRVSAAELKFRRTINLAAGNPRRLRLRKKPTVQLFPRGARLQYQRALVALVRQVQELIKSEIVDALPFITAEAAAVRNDAQRLDGPSDEVRKRLANVALIMGESIAGDESVTILAENIGASAANFNRRQVSKQFITTLGIDIGAEPFLAEHMRSFVAQNVTLIKSVVGQPLRDAEAILQRGIRQGLRHEVMAKQIAAKVKAPINRAKLIARDQTAKLNGELTQLRQQQVGVTRYIWDTSKDERVRDSHMELDGTTQEWANPPIVDGEAAHPGQPINCRCVAIPIVADLLQT